MNLEWSQEARERFFRELLADPFGQLLIACALLEAEKRNPEARALVQRLLGE